MNSANENSHFWMRPKYEIANHSKIIKHEILSTLACDVLSRVWYLLLTIRTFFVHFLNCAPKWSLIRADFVFRHDQKKSHRKKSKQSIFCLSASFCHFYVIPSSKNIENLSDASMPVDRRRVLARFVTFRTKVWCRSIGVDANNY